MKLRKLFLLLLLTLLFLGLSYATEVSNDTTRDTNIVETNGEVVQSSNMPIKEVGNTIYEKNTKKEISKQYNDTVKTESSKTYTVNDFDTLHNALTSDTYSTVTLNIKSDIRLASNTPLNYAINKLTINGNGKTINGNNQYQFLDIDNYYTEVKINNIKITNCYAGSGGAIINEAGTLIITNSTLNNNTAGNGGTIYNSATLTLINSTLNNNIANGCGGAINNYFGKLTITNSTLNNNTAGNGGAIYNNEWTLTVTNCTLNNNKATEDAGAIYNSAILTLTKSTLNNNTAGNGGAIYSFDTLTVTNCTLNNNLAASGGVIYNRGYLDLEDGILNNNQAELYGGAVYIKYQNTIIIKNNNFFNNTAIYGSAISTSRYYDMNEGYIDLILIAGNNFRKNHANTDGKAINILYERTNAIIKNNENDDISQDNSTILIINGTSTTIMDNIFDDGRTSTMLKHTYMGNVNYGSTVKIVGRLISKDTGKAIKYAQVTVKINNKSYKLKTDGAGYVRMNYTVTDYNNQKISFKYAGNSKNLPCTNSTTFKVKQPTWIKIANMTNVKYGSTVKVVARLLYNGTTALKYKQVNVTVNGKVYQVKSDGAGYIRLNYTVKNYDNQKISIKYAGSSLYLASNNSTTFKVKQPTWIKHVTVGTVKQGSVVKIVGRLLYNGTTSVKYVKVNLTVNGKVYSLKTDGAGYYRLNYTATTRGNVTFTSSFAGNDLYLASTNSTTFTVVKS